MKCEAVKEEFLIKFNKMSAEEQFKAAVKVIQGLPKDGK